MMGRKEKKLEPKKKLQRKGEEVKENINLDNDKKKVGDNRKKLEKKQKSVPKRKKDDNYLMKKNTTMVVLRILFWAMLTFVFARGAYDILKPSSTSEINQIINDFRKEQSIIGDTPEEVLKFAQDFAKEYLTYKKGGGEEFKNRIKPYVSNRIINLPGMYSFQNTAKAVYVDAYRRESYSSGQFDVFVNAEVEYLRELPDSGGVQITNDTCVLKVPVSVSENGYCVEGVPMMVVDERLDKSYNMPETITGTSIDTKEIKPALNNFLDAYYSQDQSMINYLLTADADKSKFVSLSKRYAFQKINSLDAYLLPDGKEILCLVRVDIQDAVNSEKIYQEFNVRMIKDKDKYYIKDIDPRIAGVK